MSKEDWSNEKRSDLQDALTVMSQTANPNDPDAASRVKAVEDEFLEETVPEVASQISNTPPATQPTSVQQPTNLTPMQQ